jgi:site-specific DNA-methyltransferase (adenine-specific)
MNKKWDYDVPSVELWKEVYRVLKHGGHVLSFGGTRTYHRMVVNMEDAGFEIRDQIMWLYGSGFPKSLNIGKAIDKIEGNEREVVKLSNNGSGVSNIKLNNHEKGDTGIGYMDGSGKNFILTKGQSAWEGWGTALKPANEPICLARKPLSEKSVAENVLKYGTGGINIDGCRVGIDPNDHIMKYEGYSNGKYKSQYENGSSYKHGTQVQINIEGRFPANVIHDGSDEVVEGFPDNKGAFAPVKKGQKGFGGEIYGKYAQSGDDGKTFYNDGLGSASRFFYCAKASKKDRDEGLSNFEKNKSGSLNFRNPSLSGRSEDALSVAKMGGITESRANFHPTVKPTDLMRYLCRLITPPNGIVLDPFMGSGSTGKGAILEGFDFIGMELDPEYVAIAKVRIEHAEKEYSENQSQQKLF